MNTRGQLYTDNLSSASRTLIWCWIVGEPVILQWPGDGTVAHCALCDGNPFDTPGLHEFLGRVARPGSVADLDAAVSVSVLPLAAAERIAREAHGGQTEESTGNLYILHVERVVALLARDDEKTVAWLHDVLEDNAAWTLDRLRATGVFTTDVIEAVDLLTRQPPYDYAAYIERLRQSGNALAIAVKAADLHDHLRPNCPTSLRARYERALDILGVV